MGQTDSGGVLPQDEAGDKHDVGMGRYDADLLCTAVAFSVTPILCMCPWCLPSLGQVSNGVFQRNLELTRYPQSITDRLYSILTTHEGCICLYVPLALLL